MNEYSHWHIVSPSRGRRDSRWSRLFCVRSSGDVARGRRLERGARDGCVLRGAVNAKERVGQRQRADASAARVGRKLRVLSRKAEKVKSGATD